MKVIAINGSPNKKGNTATMLDAMCEILNAEGIETEILQVGGKLIRGCTGCYACMEDPEHRCIFKDDAVNEYAQKMREADGLILGAPTYYAGIPGDMKAFLDRAFFSSSRYFRCKVGTAITAVRRTGGIDVVHQLMNFFNLAETVTPPSQYWTVGYGAEPGEVTQDTEGMQTVTRNAHAMAWLMKVIEASKGTIPLPPREKRAFMNFIR